MRLLQGTRCMLLAKILAEREQDIQKTSPALAALGMSIKEPHASRLFDWDNLKAMEVLDRLT